MSRAARWAAHDAMTRARGRREGMRRAAWYAMHTWDAAAWDAAAPWAGRPRASERVYSLSGAAMRAARIVRGLHPFRSHPTDTEPRSELRRDGTRGAGA